MKAVVLTIGTALFITPHLGAFEPFHDSNADTTALAIWQLTDNPHIRHHSNYHNVDPFSPDGRFVLYVIMHPTEPDAKRKAPATFAVYDLHEQREVFRAKLPAVHPIWDRTHNTVYWVKGLGRGAKRTLCRARLDNDVTVECEQPGQRRMPGRIDDIAADGGLLLTAGPKDSSAPAAWVLWTVTADSPVPPALLYVPPGFPGRAVYEPRANPTRPLLFARQVRLERKRGRTRRIPGNPARIVLNLEGELLGPAIPAYERAAHMCWSGDGALLLRGDGPIRGRPAPFVEPADWHILSTRSTSDVSPCGRSGRWVLGIEGLNGTVFVTDVETAFTRDICFASSVIHQPKSDRRDLSGAYDADPYGSPDGTKIYFSTNYDIRNYPVTRTRERVIRTPDGGGPAELAVETTRGFPDSGVLSVWSCLVRYDRRTTDRFLGCEWGVADTRIPPAIEPSMLVTDYRGRCRRDTNLDSLHGQAATDVYIAVVRKPDAPVLEETENGVALRPGLNHRELAAMRLYLDGQRVDVPQATNGRLRLPRAGTLTATAVEWSGLESEASNAVIVSKKTPVIPLAAHDGKSPAPQTEEEHAEDGVVTALYRAPEGWVCQRLVRRSDGTPIRRILYRGTEDVFSEEAYGPDGRRVLETVYRPDGKLMERIQYSEGRATKREELRYGRFLIRERRTKDGWVRVP